MNCTAFRTAIATALEHRHARPPEIGAHLDECRDPRCRADWDEAVLLQHAIDSWRSTQQRIDVAGAVVTAWQTGQAGAVTPFAAAVRTGRSPLRRDRPAAAGVIVAVSALAVALVAVLLISTDPGHPAAQRATAREQLAPHDNAGLACVTYARNAAQIVTDAVVLTFGGAEQMEDPRVEPIPIGWEADWPPLGEIHAALDDLMESLPSEPPQS